MLWRKTKKGVLGEKMQIVFDAKKKEAYSDRLGLPPVMTSTSEG